MPIRGVFFDAAGTLMRPIGRVGETYAQLARHYGVEASPSNITARFRSCFASAPPLAFPNSSRSGLPELECAWWKTLVQRVFEPWEPFPGFDDYFAELFSHFAQPDAWELFPEVLETLAALKEQGLILDVISNFDSRLTGILEGLGVVRYLDRIFVSSRIGYAKPAREIFQAGLDAHAVAAKNIVHVGDSKEKDFHGAIDAGLEAILVDRNAGLGAKPSWTISTLKEILPWINNFSK
jgi:putative hydrolase of the HAD superfamily